MNSFKLLLTIVAVVVLSLPARAELIPDPGIADTVDMVFSVLPDAGNNDLQVQLDLHVFHDIEDLGSMSVGFSWDNLNMQMDSVVPSPLAVSSFDFMRIYFKNNDIDSTNAARQFLFAGARMYSDGLVPTGSRQLLVSYYFTLSTWNVNDSIVIDTVKFNGGTRMQFVTTGREPYYPTWDGPKVGYDAPCCVGMTGNVDMDPADNVDAADLSFLIDHLFGPGFPELPCFDEANTDGADGVDIADLNALVDYLYINFTPLADCP